MFRTSGGLIFAIGFLSLSHAAATDCRDPFSFNSSHFYLVSESDCKATNSFTSHITSDPRVVNNEQGYFKAGCNDAVPYINLNMGTIFQNNATYDYIVYYEDAKAVTQPNYLAVTQFCPAGKVAFYIDRSPGTVNGTDGNPVATTYRVYTNSDDVTTLLGYVKDTDYAAYSIVFRNNTKILGTAKKTDVDGGTRCKAVWEVNNDPSVNPAIFSYLISLKDNSKFTCTPPGSMSGAQIALAVTLPIFTIGSIFLGTFCYFKGKKAVSYVKLRDVSL
jgi:hypothetical protein